EWLAVASRDADLKWKRKIIIGLETLKVYADKHPKAKAAMAELARQVRHPFDPTESDSIRPMNPTRNGKIARLPLAIRQELNRRLDEGEQGKKLVAWLTGLHEVQAIVAAEFGGK